MQKSVLSLVDIEGQNTCMHFKRTWDMLLRSSFLIIWQNVNMAANGKINSALCPQVRDVSERYLELPGACRDLWRRLHVSLVCAWLRNEATQPTCICSVRRELLVRRWVQYREHLNISHFGQPHIRAPAETVEYFWCSDITHRPYIREWHDV